MTWYINSLIYYFFLPFILCIPIIQRGFIVVFHCDIVLIMHIDQVHLLYYFFLCPLLKPILMSFIILFWIEYTLFPLSASFLVFKILYVCLNFPCSSSGYFLQIKIWLLYVIIPLPKIFDGFSSLFLLLSSI
jgi:hypothetical protein